MSGIDFRGLIPESNEPISFLFSQLMKKVLRTMINQQNETVDSDNEDIFSDGTDIDSAVKYHSELSASNKFFFNKDYYAPFEPDGRIVRLWLRGTGLGNTLSDISGFNNNATIEGDPTLVDGTIDLGYTTGTPKSIAMRLNRDGGDFENQEYLYVEDDSDIQITTLTTGFSIFVRFRLLTMVQQGSRSPTIFEKIDDSTPNVGVMLQVKEDDGRLVFITKRAGVTTAKQTPAATITTNTVYDVVLTFAVSGAVAHIYVNGVDQTLTNFGGSVNWQDDIINHGLYIFCRGLDNDGPDIRGAVSGDFYDHELYKERVLTSTEVSRRFTNKWSISNIPFGQVELTDYYATKFAGGGIGVPGGPSFTTTSFSPVSFHV